MTARQVAERDIRESLRKEGKKFIPMGISYSGVIWSSRYSEWHRECGDHVIIGKTKDGEYVEGVVSDEGLMFGPITNFKVVKQ